MKKVSIYDNVRTIIQDGGEEIVILSREEIGRNGSIFELYPTGDCFMVIDVVTHLGLYITSASVTSVASSGG